MPSNPITPARLAANRANAAKSTGPRTDAGKARVSQNAIKHGLRSERNPLELAVDSTVPVEHHEFLRILDDFIRELLPVTPLETRLVERMAQLELRLQRALRLETAQLTEHALALRAQQQAEHPETDNSGTLPAEQIRTQDSYLLLEAYVRGSAALDRIGRYESRLGREFARTWKQLQNAQDRRLQSLDAVGAAETSGAAAKQKMTEQTHHVQENTASALTNQTQAGNATD